MRPTFLFGSRGATSFALRGLAVATTQMRELHDALHISRREPCNRCWARFLCGGGCMHQSYLTFGDLFRPDPAECALNKHLIELASWFYAELKEKRPAVLDDIQRPLAAAQAQQS